MVDMINDVLGTDVEPEYEPIPLENYVHDTCADISKINETTGWEPQISLEEGIGRVCTPYLAD
jgi:UDP-glucose 4-epimerase